MNKFQKRVVSVVAGMTLLVNTALPVLASTTIQISGNGAGSENAAIVNSSTSTTITQNNDAKVINEVSSTAKTGGNDANFNTGGSVTVDTGNAKVTSNVSTSVNTNAADVACCGTGSTDVLIQGNGANTVNQVTPTISNSISVKQDNDAFIKNEVDSSAKTGDNDANLNTGGDVMVKTGTAEVNATVVNKANSNSAEVGGGSTLITPTASFKILGNGAGGINYIAANLSNYTSIDQDNHVGIINEVEASAKTGENDANFNVGGDVTVDTGNAKAIADVSNSANFNYASADCGCLMDVLAKIDGNGADPGCGEVKDASTILLTLGSVKIIGQDNGAFIKNELEDVYAKTGYNDANSNTGSVEDPSDPTILTGDATITNGVSTTANMNVVGGVLPLPEGWPFGGITTSFDWTALLAFFGLHISG